MRSTWNWFKMLRSLVRQGQRERRSTAAPPWVCVPMTSLALMTSSWPVCNNEVIVSAGYPLGMLAWGKNKHQNRMWSLWATVWSFRTVTQDKCQMSTFVIIYFTRFVILQRCCYIFSWFPMSVLIHTEFNCVLSKLLLICHFCPL